MVGIMQRGSTRSQVFRVSYLFMLAFLLLATSGVNAAESKQIKFGVMSLAQPARIYQQWQPFVDYVNEKTGYEVEIVIPRGFKKIKQAIAKDEVDFFYTNALIFYKLKNDGKAVALGQMENITNKITTKGAIFVRSDSGIKTVEDLKGKSIAFVSPMGIGGYVAPRAMLAEHGISTKKDLKENFTKNISSSLHRVILDTDQAGIMCGINYKLMSKKIDTSELKVIAETDAYPETIIGARSGVSEDVRNKLKAVILGMMEDKKGKEILKGMRSMKINQFVTYDNKIEAMLKTMLAQAGM